jgi:UDP-N-acetyl-D-mannosaminuronic acid dehydrogenase
MRSICVIGLGYIGLPTASLLATKGYKVHGVDVNQKIVDALNKGDVLIHEPALDVMVRSAVGSGNLTASTSRVEADVFILAVPTPFKNGKQPDLTYVESAVRAIAPCVRPGNLYCWNIKATWGQTDKILRCFEYVFRPPRHLDMFFLVTHRCTWLLS